MFANLQYYATGQGNYQVDKDTGQASQISAIPTGGSTITWSGSGLPPDLQNYLNNSSSPVPPTTTTTPPATTVPQTPVQNQTSQPPVNTTSAATNAANGFSQAAAQQLEASLRANGVDDATVKATVNAYYAGYGQAGPYSTAVTPPAAGTTPPPNTTYSGASGYTGDSIVDFLTTAGKPSDYNSRAALAQQYGIANYTGTAEQNTQLLTLLRQGSNPTTNVPTSTGTPPTQATTYAGAKNYTGASIVDFLSLAGQPSTYNDRAALAAKYGIANYTGTAAQNTQLLGILKSISNGNVNSAGVPNDIGTINGNGSMPSTTTPIPTTGLPAGNNNGSISGILGAAVQNGDIDSTIAGLLSLYDSTTASQQEYKDLNQKYIGLLGSLDQEAADYQTAEAAQGVPEAVQNLKEVTLQAAQLKAELESFDAETQNGLAGIANQPIPTGLISGQQAQYNQQRDLTRMSKAAELSGFLGLAQAYQGNITLGQQLAQQSVDLKYAPIENQIKTVQAQIGIAKDAMETEDSKRSTIISTLINFKTQEITDEKNAKKSIETLAIQAASNGAPLSVVTAMRNAPDAVAAAVAGGTFLKGNLESTAKAPGSSSTSQFTTTQKNGGASNAGLSIADFNALDTDTQNYFINGYSQFTALKKQVDSGDITANEAAQTVQDSNLADSIKFILYKRLGLSGPPAPAAASSGGGGILSSIGGAISGAWNALFGGGQ